jgi:hypothetical protein
MILVLPAESSTRGRTCRERELDGGGREARREQARSVGERGAVLRGEVGRHAGVADAVLSSP